MKSNSSASPRASVVPSAPSVYDAPQPLVVGFATASSAVEFARMSDRSFKPEDLCVLGSALRVRSLPLCPELSLWLLHDGVDLNARADELLRGGPAPYWAFCWGAGQAMARHLLDHPELVRGKTVIDFGAGSAVAGIAAARAGASRVIAVDIDPIALGMAKHNAALNGVTLEVAREVPDDWDVLLASDVLYETGNEGWLATAAESGRQVLLSDPLRHGTPRPELEVIAEYSVRTLPDVDYPIQRALIHRLPMPLANDDRR